MVVAFACRSRAGSMTVKCATYRSRRCGARAPDGTTIGRRSGESSSKQIVTCHIRLHVANRSMGLRWGRRRRRGSNIGVAPGLLDDGGMRLRPPLNSDNGQAPGASIAPTISPASRANTERTDLTLRPTWTGRSSHPPVTLRIAAATLRRQYGYPGIMACIGFRSASSLNCGSVR